MIFSILFSFNDTIRSLGCWSIGKFVGHKCSLEILPSIVFYELPIINHIFKHIIHSVRIKEYIKLADITKHAIQRLYEAVNPFQNGQLILIIVEPDDEV